MSAKVKNALQLLVSLECLPPTPKDFETGVEIQAVPQPEAKQLGNQHVTLIRSDWLPQHVEYIFTCPPGFRLTRSSPIRRSLHPVTPANPSEHHKWVAILVPAEVDQDASDAAPVQL